MFYTRSGNNNFLTKQVTIIRSMLPSFVQEIKSNVRKILMYFKIDLNQNMRYDRLTKDIMQSVVKSDSVCVDIGAHRGEVLQLMCGLAPNAVHYAFEPLPVYFKLLNPDYSGRAMVYPFALADTSGVSDYVHVKNAPAYSGLKQRSYDCKPDLEILEVHTRPLDNIIPDDVVVRFIKIDVEGGELAVLKGAANCIVRHNPVIVFEFGLGASDYYSVTAEVFFDFVNTHLKQQIYLVADFLKKAQPLTRNQFVEYYQLNKDYYFVSHAS